MLPEVMVPLGMAGRLCLTVVFLSSGLGKLGNIHQFREAVDAYDIGSDNFRRLTVVLVPLLEIGLALLWLTGKLPMAALIGGLLLLSSFTAAVAINLRRGRTVPCGCSGLLTSEATGLGTIIRNVVIAVVMFLPVLHIAAGLQVTSDRDIFRDWSTVALVSTSMTLLLFIIAASGDIIDIYRKSEAVHRALQALPADEISQREGVV
jgi:uncharacterized membrane protein YphA (DoxX/SURF4 family)